MTFQGTSPENQQAAQEWYKIFERLQQLLREAATICYDNNRIDERIKDKYFVSGRNAWNIARCL